jgi:hypothetical protein
MWNGTRRFLPTYLLGGYLGCDLFVNLIKECLELLRRIQSDEVAEVGGVETFLCLRCDGLPKGHDATINSIALGRVG